MFAEIYDKNKIYYTKKGDVVNFDVQYPSHDIETLICICEGYNILVEAGVKGWYCEKYGIADDDDVVLNIGKHAHLESTESDPLNRIASSLEYITLLLEGIKDELSKN